MKVLHVINSLAPGGAERLVADLLPRFLASGVESAVYVLDGRNDAFGDGLRAAGVQVEHAHEDGRSIYSPRRIPELRRFLRKEKPDIVHSHLGPSFHWCVLASGLGIRLVTTEHAVHNRRMAVPLLRSFERWCYRRHDRIACVSVEVARALRDWLGIPESRLPVIFNGVDPDAFASALPDAAIKAWARGRTLIAMTARFVPAKDHDTAIRALALLPERFAMMFIGDGPERPRLESLAESRGLSGRCRFAGSRTDVPDLLAASDLYLQTSVSEGFGIACLEAMAAGLPVLASAAGGLRALVDGAGLLFPPGDAEACASAILRLSQDHDLRARTKAAQALRVERHSIDATAAAYLAMYRELSELR